MSKTLKERLEAGLAASGWTKQLSDGYRISGWTKAGNASKVFVGTNGGLRAGACKSQSHSIGDSGNRTAIYTRLLALGDAAPVLNRIAELNELSQSTSNHQPNQTASEPKVGASS